MLALFLLFFVDSDWVGPLPKIWSDGQCKNIGQRNVKLSECKRFCIDTTGCTAFNFINEEGKPPGCTLRKCLMPVPEPKWMLNPFVGFHLKTSKLLTKCIF